MDVLKEVLNSTKDFEAPVRYYYWSMLAACSAILKDRVWFDMADNYKLYPNIYVILYGPSGVRKGPAIALAEELVTKVDNTRVIDGRSSIEAVIKTLGDTFTRKGKELIKDACGFMVASELSSSIIGNNSAMDIMTNLYDRQYNEKDWKYRLKVGESAKLSKPTITWLSGTNEALFRDFIPEKNLNGGLIGRSFLITETQKATSNSLMFKTVSPDKEKIVKRLKELSHLKGEFRMHDELRHVINEWYLNFDKNEARQANDDTGFVSRSLDFIIKIAMIISTIRRGDLEIVETDFLEAKQEILPLVLPAKAVVNSVKKLDNSWVAKRQMVIKYLLRREEYKDERGRLLRNLSLQLDSEDLDRIITHYQQAKVIIVEAHGHSIVYRLNTENPVISEYLKGH